MKRLYNWIASGGLWGAAGLVLAAAFLMPGSFGAVILGWIAAGLLVLLEQRSDQTLRGFVAFIVIGMSAAFYWLPDTLSVFGGFPFSVALGLAICFFFLSSVQFVFVGWAATTLSGIPVVRAWSAALPLAWMAGEFLFPRLFPWTLADTQLRWSSLASLAEVSGPVVISGLMLWTASAIVALARGDDAFSKRQLLPIVLLVLVVGIGGYRVSEIEATLSHAQQLRVGIVQGNISVLEKGDEDLREQNLARYREMTARLDTTDLDLVVWPETVLTQWTPAEMRAVQFTAYDPAPELDVPLLYGALAYRRRSEGEVADMLARSLGPVDDELRQRFSVSAYNAAFLRGPSGELIGRYFKRVLMPFGEFLPLGERLPFLYRMSPQSGMFASGEVDQPMLLELAELGEVSLMPLICYEDLVPELALAAAKDGAMILVNVTNDAWYGRSAAPFQHHVLASWRAIETRRPLIRVTNTGLTGV
ncbi:MAG: apolipoprotein N-acyltransferase, partial [Bdellovibrionales bacterium]|nr:apolipoprotein N-acyltransferase [Bdellovibrionales bacterium]